MQLTKARISCQTEGFSLTGICWHQNLLREKGRSPGGGLSTLSGAPHGTWDHGQSARDAAISIYVLYISTLYTLVYIYYIYISI